MPHWCQNKLEIKASKEAIAALKTKAKGKSNPLSEEIEEFSFLPFVDHLIPEDYEKTWHGTNHELLGCKWFPQHADCQVTDTTLTVRFDTPWDPSLRATEHVGSWIATIDPDSVLTHSYNESGCGFCGVMEISSDGIAHDEGAFFTFERDELTEMTDQEISRISQATGRSIKEIRMLPQTSDEEFIDVFPRFYESFAE